MPQLSQKIGLSPSTIYALLKAGDFPKQKKLTKAGYAVGWVESEIDAWLNRKN